MNAQSLVCPGCEGPKTKRAELCKKCRRRANLVGVDVVRHVPVAGVAPVQLRTPIQNRVYHGRIADLAKLTRKTERQVKRETLAHAAELFDRPIDSSTELTEPEMERILEWLEDEIDDAKSIAPVISLVQASVPSDTKRGGVREL